MNKALAILAAVSLGGFAVSADAGGRGYGGGRYVGPPGGAHVGARPYWGGGAYWGPRVGIYYGAPAYWGGWPYAWAAPYPYWTAPVVIGAAAAPLVYTPPAAPPVAPPADNYWYYCIQPAGYFPYVRDCDQPWLKVVPQAPGDAGAAPRLAP